jgi:putative addiction module component (TIGR02574 family)
MPPEIDMAAIKALPIDDRIALAEAIWETIEEESEAGELSEPQKTELQRRLDLYRADPTNVIPWETVKAQARGKAKGLSCP